MEVYRPSSHTSQLQHPTSQLHDHSRYPLVPKHNINNRPSSHTPHQSTARPIHSRYPLVPRNNFNKQERLFFLHQKSLKHNHI